MNVIRSNASYVVKLLINHFVSGLYSLILFAVFSMAFGGEYQFVGSLIAISFYLFMIYSFMWEAGSKRAVGLDSDKMKKTDGILVMIVGSLPYYLTTVFCAILSFFTTNAEFAERAVDRIYDILFYVNVFFSQSMYSGLFASIFGGIPSVSPFLYLASLIPGLVVGSLAYIFGSKNFRLRTVFGIKYNEESYINKNYIVKGKAVIPIELESINDLFMKHKQIVITSDKKPKEMEGIAERLISRFEQGLTVDIQNPDYETRMAILKKKAESTGTIVDESVLQYIANHFISNVRELEGSLTRVITFSKISHSPITIDFAFDVLKELVSPNQENKITCESIINIVAEHFQISTSDICSKKKSRDVAHPRQICMYLCRLFTDEKLETIGHILKKDNHATVSYGYDKIKKEIETDPSTKNLIEVLKKKINPN